MPRSCFVWGYVRKGHLVAVTRDDLWGSTSATRHEDQGSAEAAMGGVHSSMRPYYLYRPRTSANYGQGGHRDLLQVMENQRDDLVRDPGGATRIAWTASFRSNPGMSSAHAHHLDFPICPR